MALRLKLGVGRRAIQTKARHGRAPALQPRPGGGRSSPKQRLVGRPSSRACAANQPREQLHAHARIDMAITCKGAPTAESQGGVPDYFPIWNGPSTPSPRALAKARSHRRSSQSILELPSRTKASTHQTIEYPPPSPGTNHGVRASMQNIMQNDSMPEQVNTAPDPHRTLSVLVCVWVRANRTVWPSWPRRLVCTAGGS